MEEIREEKKKVDYRHYIGIVITLGFVALGIFVFPNAICRLVEAVRDFALSVAYWFCEAFQIDYSFSVTVNKLPSWQIEKSKFASLTLLPFTWGEFKLKWAKYWKTFAKRETFEGYLLLLVDILYYTSKVLIILLPFFLLFYLIFQNYLQSHNNDYGKDSRFLRFWKRAFDYTYRPVKRWIAEYVAFLKESPYLKYGLGFGRSTSIS